jgi:hypothetical protein
MGIWLEKNNIISSADMNTTYGMAYRGRREKLILNRLVTIDPKRDNKKAPKMDEVRQGSTFFPRKPSMTIRLPIAFTVLPLPWRRRKREARREVETSDEECSEEDSSSSESESQLGDSSEEESEWRKKGKKKKARKKKAEMVETRNVVVNEKVVADIDEFAKRLHGLDVKDTMYASTYVKLCLTAPAFQAFVPVPVWPGKQPAVQPMPPQQPRWQNQPEFHRSEPASAHAPQDEMYISGISSQFPSYQNVQPWSRSFDCYFCKGPNHGVKDCAIVRITLDYLAAGRIKGVSRAVQSNPWVDEQEKDVDEEEGSEI